VWPVAACVSPQPWVQESSGRCGPVRSITHGNSAIGLLVSARNPSVHEQRLEGRYVIATQREEPDRAGCKERIEVEHGFRSLKDVLALWPIYPRVEPRVKAHIFVALLALLRQRSVTMRLKEAEADLSAPHALQVVEAIRLVEFKDGNPKRGSPYARQVLKALGITKTKPPVPAAGSYEIV
jgi:hypothetical protein